MLDTDMSSYILKQRNHTLVERFAAIAPVDICVSVITKAELLFGVEPFGSMHPLRLRVQSFLQGIQVLSWDDAAADVFPAVKHALARSGQIIGPMDMMIAAHALSIDAVLVTHDPRHFQRIPALRLENWTIDGGG
jgi:tRNA(fMet)-specific endonuclease VapC